MRQIFLATTAMSLCLALAACNDDKGGGNDNSSTFNELNQKIAQLDSAQQQNKATIDDQNKEIASLKQARADDTAAFETRLAAVVKTIDERPDISPELEKRLTALQEQIGKIPAFETAAEFEAFKQELKDLRTELDKAPKTAKFKELSDSLTALTDKFASATDFKAVKEYVDKVKTGLDTLLAAADPEVLKTLKETLAGLRADLAGKTSLSAEEVKGFTDRIAALEKLIETKADIPVAALVSSSSTFACTAEELSDIVSSTPASMLDKNQAPAVVPGIAKWQGGTGNLTLTARSRIIIEPASAKALKPLADRLVTDFAEITGLTLKIASNEPVREGDIALSLSPCNEAVKTKIGNEGYTLNVGKAAILRGNIAKGLRVDEDKRDYTDSVFYATRTLLQMLMLDGKPAKAHAELKQGYAVDVTPRYSQRRIMFDLGRKFADKEFLKSYIKFMGWYKLNTLHLHLSDRDGTHSAFRLQTDNPEFASLVHPDEKAYSKTDWIELEEVAAANAVSIVPEFDTPGHSDVFALAKPEIAIPGTKTIDPSKPETLTYIKSVFSEFLPWFKSNRIHIGGDEVYLPEKTPDIVSYLNNLGAFLRSKAKIVEMWGDDSYFPELAKDFIITRWINWLAADWDSRGHTWIEALDTWYIIPLGERGAIKGDNVYTNWNKSLPADAARAPIGGQISIWNDLGWAKVYSWEEVVNSLLKDAIPGAGQVWWGGQIKDGNGKPVPYSEIRKSVGILQYGPGVTLFANSPIEGGPKPAATVPNPTTTTATDTKPACVPRPKKTCPA